MSKPQTLFDKIWDAHVVSKNSNDSQVIYIDRLMLHEKKIRPQSQGG